MKKIMKNIMITFLLSILLCTLGCAKDNIKNQEDSSSFIKSTLTMKDIGKEITDYTWVEFESLSGEEQIRFQNSFSSQEAFETWMNDAKTEKYNLPWENGGKQPEEYTWKEFEALSGAQQIQFQKTFESIEKFDEWLQKTNPEKP